MTIGNGDEFILFDVNGHVIDSECEDLSDFMDSVSEISVTFAYQFGCGHIQRKRGEPKHVPAWYSPFKISHDIRNGKTLWVEYVENSLNGFDAEFSYVNINSDWDFGYQAFIITLSKNEREIENSDSENSEEILPN